MNYKVDGMDESQNIYAGQKKPEQREYILFQSVWVGITNHYRLAGFNCEHLFLTALEAWKSKIKGLADSVSSESPLPGVHLAIFLLYLHKVEHKAERGSKLLCVFL